MGNFLLASQRLIQRPRENPQCIFELYLVTVAGFPSVALAMMDYYARYSDISQQNLATLFPFRTDIKDHLAKTEPASPYSGKEDTPKHQQDDPTKSNRKGTRQAKDS
jgi:hypothetical protein